MEEEIRKDSPEVDPGTEEVEASETEAGATLGTGEASEMDETAEKDLEKDLTAEEENLQ